MSDSLQPESAPVTTASPPNLPSIANDATDLKAIKKAVDDASSVSGALWVAYLLFMFYLEVAAGSVTHVNLFFEDPVKLPFLNIELPLLAFFALGPILFLIVHAYMLAHLVVLSGKARIFHDTLGEQIGSDGGLADDELERREAIRNALSWQLPINIFIQFLAGPENVRKSALGWLLRTIAWVTVVIAPVLLLLLFQLQYLPFHNRIITWIQRFVLVADLALLLWLWPQVIFGLEAERQRISLWRVSAVISSGFIILFSWTIAVFPGENQEEFVPRFFDLNYKGDIKRSWLPFSNVLVLTGISIYERFSVDDYERPKRHDYLFLARGRDLRGAIFDGASLPNVDFSSAELEGASFVSARLQMISLDSANVKGANLFGAKLQGLTAIFAKFQGAMLDDANLAGSLLEGAQFQGARLSGTDLRGAQLVDAVLQGALLDRARLQGASLFAANLQGASVYYTQLQGAWLNAAQLQGVPLQAALIQATDFTDSFMWRTNAAAPSFIAPEAIRLPDATKAWKPLLRTPSNENHPWSEQAYDTLRQVLDQLAKGQRDAAIERIQRLNCSNPDPSLTSCDPSRPATPEASGWQRSLERAQVDDVTYTKVLAHVLKQTVCESIGYLDGVFSGGRSLRLLEYAFIDDQVFVLRGLMARSPFNARLSDTGLEAPALIDFIMGPECPVSASLTAADKARLIQIKQDATKNLRH